MMLIDLYNCKLRVWSNQETTSKSLGWRDYDDKMITDRKWKRGNENKEV